jgi:hypothetical protein
MGFSHQFMAIWTVDVIFILFETLNFGEFSCIFVNSLKCEVIFGLLESLGNYRAKKSHNRRAK